jgi:hypothetical protein
MTTPHFIPTKNPTFKAKIGGKKKCVKGQKRASVKQYQGMDREREKGGETVSHELPLHDILINSGMLELQPNFLPNQGPKK